MIQLTNHCRSSFHLFQVIDQVIPNHSAKIILKFSYRDPSSLFCFLLSFCTFAYGDVGQEGIRHAYQMQVYNCSAIRAVLVLSQAQKLLGVLEEDFNIPPHVINLDYILTRQFLVVGNKAQDFLVMILPGKDYMAQTNITHLEHPGVGEGIMRLPIFLPYNDGALCTSMKEIAPKTPHLVLPPILEKVTIALQGGDETEILLPARLHHRRAEVEGVEQHPDTDPLRGSELSNELRGDLGGLLELNPEATAVLLLDVQADPPGDDVAAEPDGRANVLMPPDDLSREGIMDKADGVHLLAPLPLLGIVYQELDDFSRLGIELCQKVIGRLPKERLFIESPHQEEVVEPAAVTEVAFVQVAVEVADVPTSPGKCDKDHEDLEVLEVVPVEPGAVRLKKACNGRGDSGNLEHQQSSGGAGDIYTPSPRTDCFNGRT